MGPAEVDDLAAFHYHDFLCDKFYVRDNVRR